MNADEPTVTAFVDMADLEQLIAATLLQHDALVSNAPARAYDWSEVEAAIKFTTDFSYAYDPAAVSEALHQALSAADYESFLAMSGEVEAALHELLNPAQELH